MTTYAILYVDDEEKALKYFRRAIADEALTVHTASSVPEALAVLEDHGHEIAVLVTDQRMPGQTGVDLLRRVREDWPDIVRLLTTAYSNLEEAIEAVNRGEIFRYITKPWDMRQLRTELRQALELHRLRMERSLLMQEKLSVWQRLIEVNRIRDLVIMAGSFSHIRNAMTAVAAYLEANITGSYADRLTAPEQLDLWSLTETEIRRTLALADALIRSTEPAATFDTRITPRRLIESAAPEAHPIYVQEVDGVQPILVDNALAYSLVASLCRMSAASEGATVEVLCEPGKLHGAEAATVMTFLSTADSQVLEEAFALGANPEHLSAYLIAYHHGGSLQPLMDGSGQKGFRLILPCDPATAFDSWPAEDWLERILARLESPEDDYDLYAPTPRRMRKNARSSSLEGSANTPACTAML
ncbi:MAG: response regulator [Nitrococcus sp.]|nr:response regulator [Nitrococcus sp.]